MVLSFPLAATFIGLLSLSISATPDATGSSSRLRTVARFPNETFVENIATRSNGNLLVDILSSPEIYQINPFTRSQPRLVHRFAPPAKGVLGIAEIEHDVFAVVVSPNYVDTKTNQAVSPGGPTDIWTLDFASDTPYSGAGETQHWRKPVIKKVATVETAKTLNGATYYARGGLLLIADSGRGVVYRVDPKTGANSIAIDIPAFKPSPDAPLPLGINGVHVGPDGKTLYFSNSFGYKFGMVPLKKDGSAAGPARVFNNTFADDFAFDPEARYAYLATNLRNSVDRLDLTSGVVTAVAGNQNSSELAGDTSASFGRTPADRNVLYVSCSGGILAPVNGTYVEGGKVVAVDLSCA